VPKKVLGKEGFADVLFVEPSLSSVTLGKDAVDSGSVRPDRHRSTLNRVELGRDTIKSQHLFSAHRRPTSLRGEILGAPRSAARSAGSDPIAPPQPSRRLERHHRTLSAIILVWLDLETR
jgi:hypothetical protein